MSTVGQFLIGTFSIWCQLNVRLQLKCLRYPTKKSNQLLSAIWELKKRESRYIWVDFFFFLTEFCWVITTPLVIYKIMLFRMKKKTLRKNNHLGYVSVYFEYIFTVYFIVIEPDNIIPNSWCDAPSCEQKLKSHKAGTD